MTEARLPCPPPLRPFGLVLHHDGRWSHEGQPIRNRRLREHFDRHVGFLAEEGKFVVSLRHFRAEIEVEEAAFFVTIFLIFGLFSIAAGVLLIFLIFVMLAAERRSEMGMARAVGIWKCSSMRRGMSMSWSTSPSA